MANGKSPRPPRKKPAPRRRSASSSEGTRDSSGTSSRTEPPAPPPPDAGNPLGLEADHFVAPEQPTPADDDLGDRYEPPPVELLEWTPERAASIVRGGGFLLHMADGLSREPEGKQLWKATEDDIDSIAPPLARILNRYEPARRLAGLSDEGELAFGMIAYARRNLVERGQVAVAKKGREEAIEQDGGGGETWPQPE